VPERLRASSHAPAQSDNGFFETLTLTEAKTPPYGLKNKLRDASVIDSTFGSSFDEDKNRKNIACDD